LIPRLSGEHNRNEADQRKIHSCAGVLLSAPYEKAVLHRADFWVEGNLPFPRKKDINIYDKYCFLEKLYVELNHPNFSLLSKSFLCRRTGTPSIKGRVGRQRENPILKEALCLSPNASFISFLFPFF
jgi:hypothetical protein